MKTYGILSIWLGLSLMGCQTTAKGYQTHAVITDLFATFNQHDSQGLVEFYAEDAVVITPEKCEPMIGRDAIAANYQSLFNQIPDVVDTLDQVLIEGDKAAIRFTAKSRIEGAAFDLPIAAFLTLENGVITRDVVYFDTDVTPDCP